jgi:pyruvate dehydrogenase E2 component (dihydrolipoamide acetyltransferase)
MAEQAGLSLAQVKGSGPQGRIVKADVEKALAGGVPAAAPAKAAAPAPAAPAPAPQITAPVTSVPNSSMRKVIARRLSESKQTIPHFYLTVDCEIDRLLDLRKQLNAKSPEGAGAYKLSVNDFVVRAVALALRQVPAANATWTDQAVLRYDEVDVSVAVATPSGLITPVVRKADTKGLVQISSEMKDFAQRARDGKLVPEDYQGGGFTISNMGMMGIKSFSAIINPPQSCILAVGAGEPRPVVKDGALAVATVMTVTLSVDHRSVDGAIGAEFIAAFKRMIEDPLTMLL